MHHSSKIRLFFLERIATKYCYPWLTISENKIMIKHFGKMQRRIMNKYLNPKLLSNCRTEDSTLCISSYCFFGPFPMKRYTLSVSSFDISFFKSVKSCTVDILLYNFKVRTTFLMCIGMQYLILSSSEKTNCLNQYYPKNKTFSHHIFFLTNLTIL